MGDPGHVEENFLQGVVGISEDGAVAPVRRAFFDLVKFGRAGRPVPEEGMVAPGQVGLIHKVIHDRLGKRGLREADEGGRTIGA